MGYYGRMKDVSIKITEQEVHKFSSTPIGYIRLQKELSIYQTLEGIESIPKITSVSESPNNIDISMELIEGQSLKQILGIRDRYISMPIPWAKAKKLIELYVTAEMNLLTKNALYRDLNFDHLIFENQRAVLIDLESTIIGDGYTWKLKDMRGTWETMAPEEFSGYGTLTSRTATYRVAVVAYQILTGQLPFKRFPNSRSLTNKWRTSHSVKVSPLLNDTTRRIFNAALARKPERRYSNPTRFLDKLSRSYLNK